VGSLVAQSVSTPLIEPREAADKPQGLGLPQ
jgi:hypothetical protein